MIKRFSHYPAIIAASLILFTACTSHSLAHQVSTTTKTTSTAIPIVNQGDFQVLMDAGGNFRGTGKKATHETSTKYSYGQSKEQWGKLFLPDNVDEKTPVVVFIHGGGYEKQVTAEYANPLCRDIASYNMACWNIEYRRLGTGGGVPATIQDVITGINYLNVLKNTPNAPIDSPLPALNLSNVIVIGHSAGAQLANIATTKINTTPKTPITITKFIGLAGVYDLVFAVVRDHDKYLQKFLKVPLTKKTLPTYEKLSPIMYAAKMQPVKVLLFAGSNDTIVNPLQTWDYYKQLKKKSVNSEIVIVQRGNHTNIVNVRKRFWAPIRAKIISFVNS